MIKGVLFDFDGVIVKSMEDHLKGWQQVFSKYGVKLEAEDLFLLEGQGVRSVALQMMRKHGIPDSELDNIISEKKKVYEQIKNLQLYPGLKETLEELHKKGIKLGVVTGGDKKRVMHNLEYFGIKKYFEAIVTEDDVTHTKPHPEPFLKGAEKLGFLPAECIVVENAPLGIKSAKAAGCKCAAITNTLREEYLSEADYIIDRYRELLYIIQEINNI